MVVRNAAFAKVHEDDGQMTIEFAMAFPIFIIIAVIAVNALLFFSECAAFDRLAKDAVRVYAASPAFGQTAEQSAALVADEIRQSFTAENLDIDVCVEGVHVNLFTYTATLSFRPTLFGMGLKSEVLGIALPPLTYSTALTVDRYKPGVVL